MPNKVIFFFIVFCCFCHVVFSQVTTITGRVTNKDNNINVAGATVQIKGGTNATSTNVDGLYSIKVPTNTKVLIFSASGSKVLYVSISNRSVIDVQLENDIVTLETTVITALGLRGDRDKFASSSTTLKGNSIAKSGETGLLNGISSKAAGVIVTRSGGDPGAGSYIQIRGQNTIGGNSQPLFIVDGMPVSNSSDNIGASRSNGIVQQSRINDINPDDIERIEILKGASAAALWGSRAANGVIIITTKKGKSNNGKLNVYIKSSVSFDQVNKMPLLQTRYGQGTNGLYVQGGRSSFGDLIADRIGGDNQYITNAASVGYQGYVTLSDGSTRYAVAPGTANNTHGGKNDKSTYNHSEDAFRKGYYFDNTINLSGGNAASNFFIGYGHLNQQGIVKSSSDYDRKSARLNASTQFTSWFSSTVSVAYTKIKSTRVQEGDNADGVLLSSLRTPADFDNNAYNGTYTDVLGQVFTNAHISYRNPLGKELSTIYANPFWNILNNKNTSDVDRIIGSLQFNSMITPWLNTTARFGIDNFTDNRLERFARNSANFAKGYLSQNVLSEKQFNTDFFAIIKKTFTKKIEGSLLLGFNYNSHRRATLSTAITNLIIPTAPDILTNATSANLSANNFNALTRTYGFYAQADVEINQMLNFTFTGRNEYASTFGIKTNNSFFFPTAALAWQFTQLKVFGYNSFLSFGKLRATWGQVGIQPQPYQNFNSFGAATYRDDFSSGLSGISPTYNGGYARNTTAGNEYLRPEIKTETELGIDLRFFKNKVSLSATFYNNNTKDVILPISIPSATGFTTLNSNAAQLSNKGIEVDLGATIFKKGNFKWEIASNFSTNKNNVTSLAGAKAYTLPESFIQNSSLIPDQPFGVFYSTDFLKNKNGDYLLDVNGFPQAGTGFYVIGDPNRIWRGGLGSTLSYKGFSIYVLFDKVAGNDIFNGTKGSLYSFGTHADQGNTVVSPSGGLKDVNGNTIPAGTSFQGQIKDFGAGPVAINQAWYQGRGSASNTASYKQFVEDGSASRLREITLAYQIKSMKLFKKMQPLTLDLSLTGRNLVLWTDYSGIDPEANVTGVGLARGQDWFTNPSTKSVLFTVILKY